MLTNWLARITMYRLLFYILIFFVLAAVAVASLGLIPYSPLDIITSLLELLLVCWLVNQLLARLFRVSPNVESQYITALILALILTPGPLATNWGIYALAGATAMVSKYVLVWRRRHIFNPAALGSVIVGLVLHQSASWWMSVPHLAPLVLLGGMLIVIKTRRVAMTFGFLFLYLLLNLVVSHTAPAQWLSVSLGMIKQSPILFFGFILLIEPLTSPPSGSARIGFGLTTALLAILYQVKIPVAYTFELGILSTNLITRLIWSEARILLRLKRKTELAANVFGFWFTPDAPMHHRPGQYLEWTLPHSHPDSRGIRRYFTIASSPTENDVLLAVKILPANSSSFKRALAGLVPGATLLAAHVEGDFTLPLDPSRKLFFIAGGIGVTPFRSMFKYLIDSREKRDIVLFYAAKSPDEFAFHDLFKTAEKKVGARTVYVASEPDRSWTGRTGYIDPELIREEVPDYRERLAYISGPEPMVVAFQKMLVGMGMSNNQIKRDFFPGYTEKFQPGRSPTV